MLKVSFIALNAQSLFPSRTPARTVFIGGGREIAVNKTNKIFPALWELGGWSKADSKQTNEKYTVSGSGMCCV
jgi:hypothetical protein